MRIKILNNYYELVFCELTDALGDCDSPWHKKKQIRISSTLDAKTTLRIVIHEVLHAADWYKSEDWVHNISTKLAESIIEQKDLSLIKPVLKVSDWHMCDEWYNGVSADLTRIILKLQHTVPSLQWINEVR